MKKIFVLFLFTLSTSLLAQEALTLKKAYELALKESYTLKKLQSDNQIYQYEKDQLKSNNLPQVDLQGSYLQQDPKARVYGTSDSSQTSVKVHLSQSLYEGGRHRLLQEENNLLENENRLRIQEEKASLLNLVSRSYFSILRLQRELLNFEESLKLNEKKKEEIRSRIKIGRSKQSDISALMAKIGLLLAQMNSTKSEIRLEELTLKRLTGLSSLEELTFNEESVQEINLNDLLMSLDHHPLLQRLKISSERSTQKITEAKSEHLPTLGLTSNYYIKSPSASNQKDWDVGLNLTLPLYAGGKTVAETKIRREEWQKSLTAFEESKTILKEKLAQMAEQLNSLKEKKKLLKEALFHTQKNYEAQEKDYKLNTATNLDVLTALNDFQETKRSFDDTTFEINQAYYSLLGEMNQIPREFEDGSI